MRAQSRFFVVLGVLLLAGGLALLAFGLVDDSELQLMWLIFGGTGISLGVVMILVGRYLGQFAPGAIPGAIPATGTVVSTRDTGTTINGVNMVLAASVQVHVAGRDPYPAEVKLLLGRTQWGAIQPGMVVPLLVDPDRPERVAFDPSRPVQATAGAGLLGGAAAVPSAGAAQVVTLSAADIIARGRATTGRLEAVTPTGVLAGTMAPGLDAERADDPLARVAFTYELPGGAEHRKEAIVRVPDGKGEHLVPGAVVPVRFLADDPDTATIDWDRL